MDKQPTVVDFYLFLAERDALQAFKRERGQHTFLKPISTKFSPGGRYLSADTAISGAFLWSDTPQGHGFWSDIDTAWRDLLQCGAAREDCFIHGAA